MQALTCPSCSAPANPAPGQPMYQCQYCRTSFATGMAPPPPPQPQQQQGPTFIILAPGMDDDHDHHHHEFHHVAQTHAVASGIGWLVWVIVMVVVVGAGGGGWAFFARHSSFASGLVWDGSAPFNCGGNDNISVKGVKAEFNAGTAVTVGGNCHFTCTDCTIKAPTVFDVGGNGNVTIINGTVIGSEILVDAAANARVNISGNVTAGGAVKQSSNAKVSAPKQAAPPAATPSPATPTPPAVPAAAAAPATKPAAAKPAVKASPAKTR